MFFEIINQYYCIIFLQRLSHYYFFSESFSFYEHFDSYQSGFFNISWFPWLFTQEYFSWQSSGIERFYPAYLLLLNLINTVRFSQTMSVIQFAAINLILISLILCQTLKLWCWQFILYFFLSGHQTLLYVYDKTNYQWFRLFFLPSSYMQTLYYFIACLKIFNTISLAIVLTIMFVYTFFLLMDNLVIVKLTPSTFIISPSLIWSKGNNYILWLF